MKKFSIGLNPKFEPLDFCKILLKYKDSIDSIYTSPPILLPSQNNITSRHFLNDLAGTKSYQHYIDYVCKYAQDHEIKIDMAINGFGLTYNDLEIILEYLDKYHPDEITLLDQYKNFFKIYYPYSTFYIYSYNSQRPSAKEFNDPFWNSYAISNEFFWNTSLWPNDLSKELRFVLNTGCPAGGPPCYNTVDTTACKNYCITRYKDVASFFAYHIWFGKDLELFENKYKNRLFKYKLTTRNRMCDIQSLDQYLFNLINIIDIKYLPINQYNNNSFIYFCFAPFWQLHQKDVMKLDIEQLRKEKIKLYNYSTNYEGNSYDQFSFENYKSIFYKKNNFIDNQLLKTIFLKQNIENLTLKEKQFLGSYNLKLIKFKKQILIATAYNQIILQNFYNNKINYIDMIGKKDLRFSYNLELNKNCLFSFGDYVYPITFQGKEQMAINGLMQKKLFTLKEDLYRKKSSVINYQEYNAKLLNKKSTITSIDNINKHWNKNWNQLRYNTANTSISKILQKQYYQNDTKEWE